MCPLYNSIAAAEILDDIYTEWRHINIHYRILLTVKYHEESLKMHVLQVKKVTRVIENVYPLVQKRGIETASKIYYNI